jgi:acyl-CoA synthetase (NDP forming)
VTRPLDERAASAAVVGRAGSAAERPAIRGMSGPAGSAAERPAIRGMSGPAGSAAERPAIRAMLEARSIAVVGASPRPGSFGDRVITELARSHGAPEIHLVNPRYTEIAGLPCLGSLAEIPGAVDLVLCCVGDASLESQFELAAGRGDRSAVIYGSAVDADGSLRRRIAAIAVGAGMEVCGGGCMGFVNRVAGLRAIGYLEPYPLPAGPIALVTHSGSAFSALLRADRRLGWTVAVSSGQELVTTTSSYIDYALSLPETEVVALLLETLRSPTSLRSSLARCAEAGVPVVMLAVGGSPGGRAMVAAHSGALAGDDATWEALCDAHGVLRVRDLDEMADTLELLATGRRIRVGSTRSDAARVTAGESAVGSARSDAARVPAGEGAVGSARPGAAAGMPAGGIAAVHDSGAERALVVDVAHDLGVPFAAICERTNDRLAALLDPGLEPGNPLDVWGTGAGAKDLFAACLLALAEDDDVDAVALCVDLVPELDGDTAYPEALLDTWGRTTKPLCLVSNLPSALDRPAARRLRDTGIPVLEGTRTGLLALSHLLELARTSQRRPPAPVEPDAARRDRWLGRLARGQLGGAGSLALLRDYGIVVPQHAAVATAAEAIEAAASTGWPVALKTDEPSIAHKSDAAGVILGLDSPAALERAYADMAGRLGSRALVMAMALPGPELALGIVRDPLLGPVVVVGAGGVLVELLADRAVALPPVDVAGAHRLLDRLALRPVLDGVRGAAASDLDAVAAAVVAVSQIAVELGEGIIALDVNPLRCGPSGAVALDALVVADPQKADSQKMT